MAKMDIFRGLGNGDMRTWEGSLLAALLEGIKIVVMIGKFFA